VCSSDLSNCEELETDLSHGHGLLCGINLLVHNYSSEAGQTRYWDTSDSESAYLKNIQCPEKKQQLQNLGYLNVEIEYKFNQDGFRTHELDQSFDIVCFGCSFTMGTGVHAKDSWPEQLQLLTGLQIANLGHAGSSNDTAFRLAAHYLPLLTPKYAIWLQTDMHRIELLEDDRSSSLNIIAGDTANPCANDYFIKTWHSSSSNQLLNLQKNTLAFKHLCYSLGITAIIMPRNKLPCSGTARDLTHPGAIDYKRLAQQLGQSILNQCKVLAQNQ
jgi:hypothetical protein